MVWECVELGIVERGRFGVSIRVVCAMIYDGMVVGGVYGVSLTMYELSPIDRNNIFFLQTHECQPKKANNI